MLTVLRLKILVDGRWILKRSIVSFDEIVCYRFESSQESFRTSFFWFLLKKIIPTRQMLEISIFRKWIILPCQKCSSETELEKYVVSAFKVKVVKIYRC